MKVEVFWNMCQSRRPMLVTLVQTILVVLCALTSEVLTENSNKVLLISFDGFRWDYMSKTDTPNLDFIVETGVKAPYIEPVFPTETLPNHYSMVTGLYPESHGIISGYYMYDPVWNATFENMNNSESRWWDGGEPVWVTNQNQGHTSGVCNFPGYDVRIRGQYPTYSTRHMGYNKPFVSKGNIMTFKQQIDVVMEWLTRPDPPSFVAVYFWEPDETSHRYGPDSDAVIRQIRRCDNITGYLLMRLMEKGMLNDINIILTGDHGHTPYNTSYFLNVDHYITAKDYIRHGITTVNIWPRENTTTEYVYERFKQIEYETGLMNVYKTQDMPDRFHYKNNRRVSPIVGLMAEHWIANTSGFWEYWTSRNRTDRVRGDHVYSPFIQSMRPFFIARGPNFKQDFVSSEPIKMVDIYPLICNILDIIPAPNNGSFGRVQALLRKPNVVKEEIRMSSLMQVFLTSFWKGMVNML